MDLGFLSPNGTFYKCDYYGHLDLAEEICRFLGLEAELINLTPLNKYLNKLTYEDFLIAKGFVAIYSRNASHSCLYMHGTRVADKIISRVHLSEKQRFFIISNLNNAHNSDLCEAMNKILEFDNYN